MSSTQTPNQLENLMPKILARGMLSFRNHVMMPRLVNSNFSTEAAQKGDSVDVMISGNVDVQDVVPSHTAPTPPSSAVSVKSITLDHWKKAAFYLTDKDMMQIEADRHFIPFQMKEAVSVLADEVNKSFINKFAEAEGIIYDKNDKMFSDKENDANDDMSGIKPIIKARTQLNQVKAPKEGRNGVLSFDDEAKVSALPQFAHRDKSGDPGIVINGEIGRKYGIDWYSSEHVEKITGRPTTAFTLTANAAKGAVELAAPNNLVSGATRLVRGDIIITASGVVVGSVDSIANGKVTLLYPTTTALTTSTNLKVVSGYCNNAVFHRDAFAFVTSPLGTVAETLGLGNRMMSITDPESGLSIRLEISRQYKQTLWEFDILWGVELLRPEWVIRLVSDER